MSAFRISDSFALFSAEFWFVVVLALVTKITKFKSKLKPNPNFEMFGKDRRRHQFWHRRSPELDSHSARR